MNDIHESPPPPPPERRKFLKWVTHGLGALFGVVLGVPAVLYLIDPRNRAARASDFKRVAKLKELVKDVPKQVIIRDVRQDAWTVHPNEVIGRVWLVRRDEKKVDAYTTICPHLGCSIDYNAELQHFVCPCHNGTYDLSSKRKEFVTGEVKNPAPRDMDSLELNMVPDPADATDYFIEVKYERFEPGEADKKPRK